MARRRGLRPEEEELWQTVARTARPLRDRPPSGPAPQKPPQLTPPQPAAEPPPPLSPFQIGERAMMTRPHHNLAPTPGQRLAAAPLQMDAGVFARMTRGKMAPEARIDLHGMTLAVAYPELIRFVLNAQGKGHRLVLVITGKGKDPRDHGPIPGRQGVLRHQVPQWLRLPPLSAVVQQAAEAHARHGGHGALYLWLRRL